jgi:site-specific DNA recombinase
MTETQRCALYARYSDERQNPLSIDQQIGKCREYAERHDLLVLNDHIYADEAISGATDDRAGLRSLLQAAQKKPRPFDAILVDDTSRMSRDLGDSLEILKKMKFAGVRVVFVSQGFDTSAPQMQTLVTVHGLVDSLYLEELANKTYRGVEHRALHGLHTGGRVFGYQRVPIESQTQRDSYGRAVIHGVRLQVDPGQAATICRIFELYARGDSMKRIAIALNDDGILSPQPQKGRVSQSWCPSSVRHILLNERYRGTVTWGRAVKVRSPETGKRIYRRKPEMEWRKKEIPEQRIVSDELWKSVQERFRVIRNMNGGRTRSGRVLASPYLFTGLLECSECHGNITVVSGARKGRSYRRYGCSMHAHRGNKVCTNSLLIPQSVLETRFLAGLETSVFNPTVVSYTLQSFECQLLREIETHAGEAGAREKKITDLERKIRDCTAAIAEGRAFKSLLDQLSFLEAELQQAKTSLESARPGALRIRMQDTRRFVDAKLRDLQKLLNAEPRMARAEMAKHIQNKIVLRPEGKTYVAVGDWNLLGVVSYGGAGGQNRTGYARLFRAALYH